MKLNCKQGDLAIIVRSADEPQHIGKILRCVKFNESLGIPAWEFEPEIGHFWLCRDSILRPIRDQPGDDETLEWAGQPNPAGVAA